FDNIRKRMKGNDHATMSLFRCKRDGDVVFAGAHEAIIVYRAATGEAELIDTPGTWVGAMADVSHAMVDTTLRLGPDDLMVLYTDGVIEARNERGEFVGMDRLTRAVEAHHAESVETVRLRILEEVLGWAHKQDDDITLVVVRRAPETNVAHVGQA